MTCPCFSKGCGGCSHMDLPYEETLRQKEKAFRKLFPEAYPVLSAEQSLHYRNKALRTFTGGKGKLTAGIYQTGTHRVIPVRDCLLENRGADRVLGIAAELLNQMGLPAYNEDTHRGILRHMQLRRATRTGETLLTVITGSEVFPGGHEFARELMKRCHEVKGIIHNINSRDSSAVLGVRDHLLEGVDEIRDEMSGLQVVLKSRSFYQVHTAQAEKLYHFAIEAADLSASDHVLDAYCGVGLIGMLAASSAGQVTGIELVKPSIECAVKAARLNHIDNIRFLCGDAVKALRSGDQAYTAVIADPPRAGCSEAFLNAVIRSSPMKMVYISCNPETLYRDIQVLKKAGYHPAFVQPVDLFPFTEHIEAIVLLSRGEIDKKRI